ncbi:MAG: hypothetical protein ACLGID_21120 [Gammaproteobacteria bacterium]
MTRILLLLCLVVVALDSHADARKPGAQHPISFSQLLRQIRTIKYMHTIDGYQIKCDKTKALVWGKPNKFNANHPQDGEATLVDLEKNRIVRTFGLSSGIFGAGFLKDGQRLNIESGTGVMIDLRTAAEINYDYYFDTEGKYEECPEFKGQSFPKYSR